MPPDPRGPAAEVVGMRPTPFDARLPPMTPPEPPGIPVRELAARVITREREAATGRRPPAHSLLQRLTLLAGFEATLGQHPSRADFARHHGVRPDYLHDLLTWACSDASGAQLFIRTVSADAPGRLTPVARHLLFCLHPSAQRGR